VFPPSNRLAIYLIGGAVVLVVAGLAIASGTYLVAGLGAFTALLIFGRLGQAIRLRRKQQGA
jgi:hypothetical protein